MLPRKTPRFRLTKATAPALEPRSGAQHRPKAPTRASPGVAEPRLDAEFLPAGAVDVETHKAEHDCLYDAIRAGLLEQGVSQVPGDAKGMRRVVMEACHDRSTGAFKLETGSTLAQTSGRMVTRCSGWQRGHRRLVSPAGVAPRRWLCWPISSRQTSPAT